MEKATELRLRSKQRVQQKLQDEQLHVSGLEKRILELEQQARESERLTREAGRQLDEKVEQAVQLAEKNRQLQVALSKSQSNVAAVTELEGKNRELVYKLARALEVELEALEPGQFVQELEKKIHALSTKLAEKDDSLSSLSGSHAKLKAELAAAVESGQQGRELSEKLKLSIEEIQWLKEKAKVSEDTIRELRSRLEDSKERPLLEQCYELAKTTIQDDFSFCTMVDGMALDTHLPINIKEELTIKLEDLLGCRGQNKTMGSLIYKVKSNLSEYLPASDCSEGDREALSMAYLINGQRNESAHPTEGGVRYTREQQEMRAIMVLFAAAILWPALPADDNPMLARKAA